METVDRTREQMSNTSREMETLKWNHGETTEQKDTTKTTDASDRFTNGLGTAKENN